jgi:hypothetical protein
LTEANVKDGLHLPNPVVVRVFFCRLSIQCPAELLAGQAETWGALETFRRRSKESDTIAELEDLMNQIFSRRADSVVIPYVHFILLYLLDSMKAYAPATWQPIYLPHSPTGYPKRREETSLVRRPRKPRRSAPQARKVCSAWREGARPTRPATRQRRCDPPRGLVPPCLRRK